MKKTGLWGNFTIPEPTYKKWEDCHKNAYLYLRPGRSKPALAFLHKSALKYIPEFLKFIDFIHTDADFRSLRSQGVAYAFYKSNP
jgi:hypothetical protein